MSSPELVDLAERIALNALTPSQQAALIAALDLIAPVFPTPDELANGIPAYEQALAREWMAVLYAIQAEGVSPVPPSPPLTDVTGTPPIVVTSPTPTTRNVALSGDVGGITDVTGSGIADVTSPTPTTRNVFVPAPPAGAVPAVEAHIDNPQDFSGGGLQLVIFFSPVTVTVENSQAVLTCTAPIFYSGAAAAELTISLGVDGDSFAGYPLTLTDTAAIRDCMTISAIATGLGVGDHSFQMWVQLNDGATITTGEVSAGAELIVQIQAPAP